MYGSGQGEEILKSQYVQTIFLLVSARVSIAQEATFFFSKIVQKHFCNTVFFNFQPTCTCVTGTRADRCKKLYFFHINCYYHVHCKGPKCCRHWLEDLKGWKWIKIQIQKFFFLVLCKICLQKKLQTKIISVKKMSSNYKGENLKIDSRLFGQIQVQEIISARTFM